MKRLLTWKTLLSLLVVGLFTAVLAYTVASLASSRALLPIENREFKKDPRVSELKANSPRAQDTISPFKARDRE